MTNDGVRRSHWPSRLVELQPARPRHETLCACDEVRWARDEMMLVRTLVEAGRQASRPEFRCARSRMRSRANVATSTLVKAQALTDGSWPISSWQFGRSS